MSYRNFSHGNSDTNMYVEAFHNRLKTFYMDRKPIKRIDNLLQLLLTMRKMTTGDMDGNPSIILKLQR